MFTGMSTGGARPPGDPRLTAGTERAREALAGTRFADVRWVPATGSTNSDAMALARDGEAEGIVVVADHQSAGRGRQARSWVAPPGGSLLVSVLLRPPARVAGTVTMAAAVAMAEAVEEVSGVVAGLKWPNDLVVATDDGDRKLAGILAEADWPAGTTISGGYRAPAPDDRTVVVVGIGLNVTWPRPAAEVTPGQVGNPPVGADDDDNLPIGASDGGGPVGAGDGGGPVGAGDDGGLDEVAGIATALNWLGPPVDRVNLLVAFLRCFDHRYTALLADGPTGLLAEWRRRSATLGRRVRVDLGADDVEGTAVDVTDEGHLVVDTVESGRRTLAVGDVVHLRPL